MRWANFSSQRLRVCFESNSDKSRVNVATQILVFSTYRTVRKLMLRQSDSSSPEFGFRRTNPSPNMRQKRGGFTHTHRLWFSWVVRYIHIHLSIYLSEMSKYCPCGDRKMIDQFSGHKKKGQISWKQVKYSFSFILFVLPLIFSPHFLGNIKVQKTSLRAPCDTIGQSNLHFRLVYFCNLVLPVDFVARFNNFSDPVKDLAPGAKAKWRVTKVKSLASIGPWVWGFSLSRDLRLLSVLSWVTGRGAVEGYSGL